MKRNYPEQEHPEEESNQETLPVPINYSIEECTQIRLATERFYSDLCKTQNGHHWVVDNVTQKSFLLPKNISFATLEAYFGHCGHALAFDLNKCFSIPFVVDVDCSGCKNQVKDHQEQNGPKLIEGVVIAFNTKLNKYKLPYKYIVMQRPDHCGFHVYYSFHVSVVAYYLLLDELAVVPEVGTFLKVDRVTSLPLPFSAKEDYCQYKTTKCSFDTFESYFMVPQTWHDVTYFLSSDVHSNKTSNVLLGNYICPHDDRLENWSAAINKQYVLFCHKKFKTVNTNCLSKFKLQNQTFEPINYPVLASHLNTNEDVVYDFIAPDLHPKLEELSCIVSTNHYGTVFDRTPGYSLYKLLVEKECRYSFYLFCAIYFHLKNLDPTFQNVWLELRKLCGRNETLLTILHRMETNETKIVHLEDLFNNVDRNKINYPIVWIKCVSDQLKLVNMTYHDTYMAIHYLKTKYPIMYFSNNIDLQYYNEGMYHTTKSFMREAVFNREMLTIMQSLNLQKQGEAHNEFHTKWLSSKSTFIPNTDINIYRHFVNTSAGVWNTITHSLMEHIPTLFFNTQAAMHPINFQNINIGRFLSNQYRLWITNVVMKGLYDGAHHFSNQNLSEVWLKCREKIRPGECEDLFQQMEKDFSLKPHVVKFNAGMLCGNEKNTFEQLLARTQDPNDGYEQKYYNLAVFFSILQSFYEQNKSGEVNPPPYYVYETELSFIENTISTMFEFDPIAISEFLSVMSFMFIPSKPRSKMILFIGAAGAGKSTLTKFLCRIWAKSIYVTSRNFMGAEAGKPSPEMMAVNNNYMVVLNEIQRVDAILLKTLTGDDATHQRNLYDRNVTKQRSCATIVGVSNSYPILTNLDEAVYVRLAPFHFIAKFLSRDDCVRLKSTTNTLVLHAQNIICSDANVDTFQHAQEFLDLVYAAFVRKHNPMDSINLPVQNDTSLDCLEKIMCGNPKDPSSQIYGAMKKLKIIRHSHLSISLKELLLMLDGEITPPVSERDLKILFANNLNEDTIIGFGKSSSLSHSVSPVNYFIKHSRAAIENNNPGMVKQNFSTLWITDGYYIQFPVCFSKPLKV